MNKGLTEQDTQFLTAQRADQKLAIALKRYFEVPEAEKMLKKQYRDYLALRLRPACEALIGQEETEKLALLLEEFSFSQDMLKSLLLAAGKVQNQEAQILLLAKKQESKEIQERGWEL